MSDAVNVTETVTPDFAEYTHAWLASALESTGHPVAMNAMATPWIFFLVLVVAGFICSYGFVWLTNGVVRVFTRKTETDLDDKLLDRLQHPVAMSLFILFLNIALVPLSLNSVWADIFNKILASANILLIGTIINRVISTLIMHFGARIAAKTDSTVDDRLVPIVRKMITAVIYCIAVLAILSLFGVQIAPLLAGAGIAGIAIAFALQETLRNIFGGVSLAFDHAYGVGDRIKLADGTVGVVIDISLRSTKIRTFDGDLITVPNGKIANEMLQTYAQPTAETRVVVDFGVAYGSSLAKTREVVLEAIKGIPNQIQDAERGMINNVFFMEMAAYSLQHRAVFWVNDYHNSFDAKIEANNRIYNALAKAKIEIPFPVTTVVLKR